MGCAASADPEPAPPPEPARPPPGAAAPEPAATPTESGGSGAANSAGSESDDAADSGVTTDEDGAGEGDPWAGLEAVPADARHTEPRGAFPAVFLRAYDGDTLTAAVAYRGGTHVVAVRLAGVNAPELRPPKSAPDRDATVAAARAARDALAAWGAEARRLTLEARGYEKFGRWLAVARPAAGGTSLNRRLLDAGHAVPYLAEISD